MKVGILKVLNTQVQRACWIFVAIAKVLLDIVSNRLNHSDISDDQHLKEQAPQYFTAGLHGQHTLDDAPKQEHSGGMQESPSPAVTSRIQTLDLRRPYRVIWNKFSIKESPLIVFKHTQLTRAEQDEIDKMEIPQLLDKVRRECPERESLLFPKRDWWDGGEHCEKICKEPTATQYERADRAVQWWYLPYQSGMSPSVKFPLAYIMAHIL